MENTGILRIPSVCRKRLQVREGRKKKGILSDSLCLLTRTQKRDSPLRLNRKTTYLRRDATAKPKGPHGADGWCFLKRSQAIPFTPRAQRHGDVTGVFPLDAALGTFASRSSF